MVSYKDPLLKLFAFMILQYWFTTTPKRGFLGGGLHIHIYVYRSIVILPILLPFMENQIKKLKPTWRLGSYRAYRDSGM